MNGVAVVNGKQDRPCASSSQTLESFMDDRIGVLVGRLNEGAELCNSKEASIASPRIACNPSCVHVVYCDCLIIWDTSCTEQTNLLKCASLIP